MRALIIEDEPRSQKTLQLLVQQHCPQVSVSALCRNGAEGIKAVEKHAPQMVFLDIRMPGADGFEFLDHFSKPPFEIVFVTAYDQYAIAALRRCAIDYLLKPVSIPELKTAVDKVEKRLENVTIRPEYSTLLQNQKALNPGHQKLAVPSREGLDFLELNEIVKLQAERNYTRIHTTTERQILSTQNLKVYEDILPEELFFRSHHSSIINLRHVSSYIRGEGGQVVLSNNLRADISKRRKKDFLQVFGH